VQASLLFHERANGEKVVGGQKSGNASPQQSSTCPRPRRPPARLLNDALARGDPDSRRGLDRRLPYPALPVSRCILCGHSACPTAGRGRDPVRLRPGIQGLEAVRGFAGCEDRAHHVPDQGQGRVCSPGAVLPRHASRRGTHGVRSAGLHRRMGCEAVQQCHCFSD
jgi:hypothetical protein